MTLDPTAKTSNIKDSVKKHFVDKVQTIEGIPVTFDKALSTPDIQGKVVKRWVNVIFGQMEIDFLSDIFLEVYCCTRSDPEGFKLAQVRDKVVDHLSVEPATANTNLYRIPFYRSYFDQEWVEIGSLLVQEIIESGEMNSVDETKYKILTVRLRTASKV